MKKKVVILGDSLLKPVVMNQNRKYCISKTIEWEEIEKALDVEIENHSRMGATIHYGYTEFKEYLTHHKDCYAVVIEYGGNDCSYHWQEVSENKLKLHLPKTSKEEFVSILNKIIDMAEEHHIKPILITLPPISALTYYHWLIEKGLNKENIMHHLKDVEVISRHQEFYNNMIVQTAYKRKVDLVDVRQDFLLHENYMSLMCEDGVHPNRQGEQLIIDSFLKKYGL